MITDVRAGPAKAVFKCTWCPPSGGPREVRLKPDTTYALGHAQVRLKPDTTYEVCARAGPAEAGHYVRSVYERRRGRAERGRAEAWTSGGVDERRRGRVEAWTSGGVFERSWCPPLGGPSAMSTAAPIPPTARRGCRTRRRLRGRHALAERRCATSRAPRAAYRRHPRGAADAARRHCGRRARIANAAVVTRMRVNWAASTVRRHRHRTEDDRRARGAHRRGG